MEALRAWRASGQSLEDFARGTGIQEHRLARWVRRAGGSVRAIATPAMLPVRIIASSEPRRDRCDASKVSMEIALASGRRVIVAPGFDGDELARLLEVVERA